jgi:ribosomal protein S18 acetylase RimI-like enzyme
MLVEFRSDWDDATLQALSLIHQEVLPYQGWDFPSLKSTLETGGTYIRFACIGSTPTGFILYRDSIDCLELLTIAVAQNYQRQKIGRHLIEFMLNAYAEKPCLLEVAADNIAAQHLYHVLGFIHINTRKAYYFRGHKPASDALIFKRPPISQEPVA